MLILLLPCAVLPMLKGKNFVNRWDIVVLLTPAVTKNVLNKIS